MGQCSDRLQSIYQAVTICQQLVKAEGLSSSQEADCLADRLFGCCGKGREFFVVLVLHCH